MTRQVSKMEATDYVQRFRDNWQIRNDTGRLNLMEERNESIKTGRLNVLSNRMTELEHRITTSYYIGMAALGIGIACLIISLCLVARGIFNAG